MIFIKQNVFVAIMTQDIQAEDPKQINHIIIDRQAVCQLIIKEEDEYKKYEVEDTVHFNSVRKEFV